MILDSKHYSWNDTTLFIGTKDMGGVTKIEVEFGWDQEGVQGKGGKLQAINETNFGVSGTIGLLQADLEAIFDTYGENYQKQYFDIVWNFTGEGDVAPRTHTIKRAKLGKVKMGIAKGDAFMEVDVPFMALDIKLAKN